jgi:Na+-transporting methylmalonyl-CoA/oxaloacetate decarboxylase gamma subunit
MNIESFSYAVLTTVVGMGIVFGFLIVLSVLMVIIRGIFDGNPGSPLFSSRRTPEGTGAAAASAGAGTGRTGTGEAATGTEVGHPADEVVGGVPRWVVAATLAYLAEEEREYAPRAGGWAIRSIR